jgi:hypothetical protein
MTYSDHEQFHCIIAMMQSLRFRTGAYIYIIYIYSHYIFTTAAISEKSLRKLRQRGSAKIPGLGCQNPKAEKWGGIAIQKLQRSTTYNCYLKLYYLGPPTDI